MIYECLKQLEQKQQERVFPEPRSPIPLEECLQSQPTDAVEELMRKMRKQRDVDRANIILQQQQEQKELARQRKALAEMIRRNKSHDFTYDYDGTLLERKKPTKRLLSVETAAPISYAIGDTEKVAHISRYSKQTAKQQQQQLPSSPNVDSIIVLPKLSVQQQKNNAKAVSVGEWLNDQQTQGDSIFDALHPVKGVTFKSPNGRIKRGQDFNSNFFYQGATTKQNPRENNDHSSSNITRMSRLGYNKLLSQQGNYSRNYSLDQGKQQQTESDYLEWPNSPDLSSKRDQKESKSNLILSSPRDCSREQHKFRMNQLLGDTNNSYLMEHQADKEDELVKSQVKYNTPSFASYFSFKDNCNSRNDSSVKKDINIFPSAYSYSQQAKLRLKNKQRQGTIYITNKEKYQDFLQLSSNL